MSTEVKEVAIKLLGLPTKLRALLAEQLIKSLDEAEDEHTEILWINEAKRRYTDVEKEKVKLKPAKKVFLEARKKVK